MADTWDDVRREVTCSLCSDLFEEPKILPCLHTFCKNCLQDLWENSGVRWDGTRQADICTNSADLSDAAAQNKAIQKSEKHSLDISLQKQKHTQQNREIKCPLCPEIILLTSTDTLPPNEPAQQLVELVTMEQQISGEIPPVCQSCDNELGAVALCLQCDVFLCTACVAVHKKLKLLSSHQVVSFDNIKTSKVDLRSIFDSKQEHCSVHPDQLLELFCKEEGCFICLGCAVINHRDHEYEEIFAVAQEHKEEIDCTLSDVRAALENLEKAVDGVRDRQSQVQLRKLENTAKVEKTFEEITLALNKRKQQIIDGINETAASRINALDKQREKLSNKCTLMKSFLELVEAELQSERDRTIISMKSKVVNRGGELIKVAKQTEMVEAEPSKVEFCRLPKILGLINLFGKPDIYTKKCKVVRTTNKGNISTYQVTLRDSLGQHVSGCSDVITIKVFPNENMPMELGKVPKINDQGNGCYTFSISKDESCVTSKQGWKCRCEKSGSVHVQVGSEDVPGSPMR